MIPKEEIELKFVQAWYQPGWNTYFNGHGSYNPALLLNDPELLRIDEKNKINYLRFYYPNGIEYHNICIPGSVLKHPAFQWAFEPVWDADTLQPIPCKFGRNRQFWMDIHAPKDAKAGIYRGRVKIRIDGVESGGFTKIENLALRNMLVKPLNWVLSSAVYPVLSFLSRKCSDGNTYRHRMGMNFMKARYLDDLLPLTTVTFEGHEFPAPANTDNYLRKIYGDYMRLPDIDKIEVHAVKVDFFKSEKA